MSEAPARLFTAFGTVLYVDAESGELRHGDVAASPANVFFAAEPGAPRRGRLVTDAGEPLAVRPDQHLAVPAGGGEATLLDRIPLERGLIAFAAGDVFLSAFPDGRVFLRGPACSTWELFLASEAWCGDFEEGDDAPLASGPRSFDRKAIAGYIIHPINRVRANTRPRARKLLIYGYTKWSHGRVNYDLCKHLHRRGYIVDILDWQVNHAGYIGDILPYYDLFMTALDGVGMLTDVYGVPFDRLIGLSHHEFDIRMLVEQKGVEIFDKFAAYGVVSEFLYAASLMRGVPRAPMVAPLGINYDEFYAEVPEHLETVGYASSMAVTTFGVEWKRGHLAEAAARDAGLAFKVAGSTGNQMSFHDMPDFYRGVDAVLTSSISEAAQLPAMEAAAAGRLVIGTPVGHFPLKAYKGGGILVPIEADKFKSATTKILDYYQSNPKMFMDKCRSIQEAARQFDWRYSIGDWVSLVETSAAK
jgi:glycosyltransferase involved in cell wall biosynthesis